jgi:hypothetical protein
MRHLLPVLLVVTLSSSPAFAGSGPYFEDGFLGLTQAELRAKLGSPRAVRDRKSALRVFKYYSIADWEKYYKKIVMPENGEDVYTYKRDGIEVRYSFSYMLDQNNRGENAPLYVRLVEVEFFPPAPIGKLPALVPEFKPPTEPTAPVFRSNLWILVFKGGASPAARFIVTERGKEALEWSLAFQLFTLQGLPTYVSPQTPIDRMEITAQSLQMVQDRQRQTHEPMMNPFSAEYVNHPPPPPAAKKIPVPKYAD